MDPALIQALAALILGSGGLLGAVNIVRSRKSRKRGVPGDEHVARRIADDSSLNHYWQSELAAARQDRKEEMAALRRQVRAMVQQQAEDAAYIDALERHIWLKMPPPPPVRKQQQ